MSFRVVLGCSWYIHCPLCWWAVMLCLSDCGAARVMSEAVVGLRILCWRQRLWLRCWALNVNRWWVLRSRPANVDVNWLITAGPTRALIRCTWIYHTLRWKWRAPSHEIGLSWNRASRKRARPVCISAGLLLLLSEETCSTYFPRKSLPGPISRKGRNHQNSARAFNTESCITWIHL